MEYQITYACLSHIGRRRRMNQDNFLCGGIYARPDAPQGSRVPVTGAVLSGQSSLFGVFDGMGGEERGEAASYLAAETAFRTPRTGTPRQTLETICHGANKAICDFAAQNGLGTCGTTAAMLLTDKNGVELCNLGDSKIFRLTGGEMTQISQDHLSIAPFGQKAPLSQFLGIPPEELVLCPYYASLPYAAGDRYLLCSDGLTDMVPQQQIARILKEHPPEHAAQLLLQNALDNGGKDNVTILVLEVEKQRQTPGLWDKIRRLF